MSKSNQTTSKPGNDPDLAPIEDIIAAISRGELVIMVDDEDRENEGDLIMAAQFATPEKIAFIVRHTSGVIVAPLTGERCDDLRLPLMVDNNTESHRTAFTISVDLLEGTTTGISAADRAATLRALADPKIAHAAFARPGHIFPLRAREGGVLKRAGHTEASVDLARLAGCEPAGIICEIQNDDGTMSRLPELKKFAKKHGLLISSIARLIEYRRHHERLVERMGSANVPTEWGNFDCVAYRSTIDGIEHLAFVLGDLTTPEPVLTRVHSECLTGDVFGSLRCDCGPQLATAMKAVQEQGRGVIVYLRGHEGRGIGIGHKIRAYSLQDEGLDTVDANLQLGLPVDSREYGIGAQILADLGARELRLMTNNPAKYGGIAGYGLSVVERVSIITESTPENSSYLATKRDRLGHFFNDMEKK
ncbi:MAG: bifunctional 3,4-dihydroxy-2-butanone-4-phosphate synthase/GTP cyclohydrolase II [Ilumatobacteraceae bacterium]|jgi:3,4-dihydroxy 2-butanone 4-phosphate synthase / GTP cyclohydrolase II|nr:MAG: 3,4-dihydroxy-2-butanone 4-phosphate synthase [Acidimicrobium sp. BACL27 MAG-120823-bin4]MDP4634783.1 bifunctional 3,4-dihydroxy-2-butanone-4-phosphate synthase/GTP cyclohydrolase II [Ilumatobacteraceae bacterium]MDP4736335.1 bifunctional 3,4-dihydroxy-2-butanone-4-phosphate synthase/GTP cyclohydrolase II [Ilumatobacteraceae bacterium]MDP4850827.1 bifunctional 3,4-dihydroxy-2-butanone-4-phosphate synthase/GTP cyclohydrolase II [Ilumatobacteraceae bacterium]